MGSEPPEYLFPNGSLPFGEAAKRGQKASVSSLSPPWDLFSSEDLPGPNSYPPGTDLYRQGWPPRDVFVIKTGAVKLSRTDPFGKEMIGGLRRAGQVVGVASAFMGEPYPETATTLTRCDILRLPRDLLARKIGSSAAMTQYLMLELCRDHYRHTVFVEWCQTMKARDRVLHVLLDICQADQNSLGSTGIKVPALLKDWEIAQFVGVTPQRYSQLLSDLEESGMIRRRQGALIILRLTSR